MAYTENDRLRFLALLQRRDFHVANTCREFGVSRDTYYEWMKDEDFARQVQALSEAEVDDAESMHRYLRRGIPKYETLADNTVRIVGWEKEPDRLALEFFLERKGKSRGWTKEIQVRGSGENGEIVMVQVPVNGREYTPPNTGAAR